MNASTGEKLTSVNRGQSTFDSGPRREIQSSQSTATLMRIEKDDHLAVEESVLQEDNNSAVLPPMRSL